MLTGLDLFSGYGGIALGLHKYVRPIAYCEIEPYARAILSSRVDSGHLPEAPILPDVRKLRGTPGFCDIIYGGFPCQDISSAGRGVGLGGQRSGLFFEIIRLTKEIRPNFVFLENVPAIRTRGLEQVIKAFTEVGYDCRWTMLSAESIGAPHRRERWFLLAHSHGSNFRFKQRRLGRESREGQAESGYDGEKGIMAHPVREGLEGNSGDKEEAGVGWLQVGHGSLFDGHYWESEPDVGRVANGTPFRVERLKALGNGVVPLQVQTAWEKLLGISYE